MGALVSKHVWTQSAFIPAPTLTETNLPSQIGKVHIVTGGYAGIGEQLVKILYSKGAKVYVAGRSEEKAKASISRIEAEHTSVEGKGELVFLYLDLSDLATIKASAEKFLSQETRLDVLVNNAGVMFPPAGSKGKQDIDLQFVTNCLGPQLFTTCLSPILKQTASTSAPNSVRVIWASSLGIAVLSPTGGVQFDSAGKLKSFSQQTNYGQTKVGNVLLAIKFQELLKEAGVVSVSFNPGNLASDLQRHTPGAFLFGWILYHPRFGAYTELWSGWSEDVTIDKKMTYVMPWGRDGSQDFRTDILAGIEQGDTVEAFWKYCESETLAYS